MELKAIFKKAFPAETKILGGRIDSIVANIEQNKQEPPDAGPAPKKMDEIEIFKWCIGVLELIKVLLEIRPLLAPPDLETKIHEICTTKKLKLSKSQIKALSDALKEE